MATLQKKGDEGRRLLIAMDFDGTLFCSLRKQIVEPNRQLLASLRQRSDVVSVVASGRNILSMCTALGIKSRHHDASAQADSLDVVSERDMDQRALEALPVDYVVLGSGAVTMSWPEQTILATQSMSNGMASSLCAALVAEKVSFFVLHAPPHMNESYYFIGEDGMETIPDFVRRKSNYSTPFLKSNLSSTVPPIEEGAEKGAQQFAQLIVMFPSREDARLPHIEQALHAAASKRQFTIRTIRTSSPTSTTGVVWLEVFPGTMSKAIALEALEGLCWRERNSKDARLWRRLAIGNDYNDIDMLKWGNQKGDGMLVANSPEPLKAMGEFRVTHGECGQGAVAEAIDGALRAMKLDEIIIPRRAWSGTFTPKVAASLQQLSIEKGYSSDIFLTFTEVQGLGLEIPPIDFKSSSRALYNVSAFPDPPRVAALIESHSHIKMFGGPFFGKERDAIESFARQNGITSSVWITSFMARLCNALIGSNCVSFNTSTAKWISSQHTSNSALFCDNCSWKHYTPRALSRFDCTHIFRIKLGIAALKRGLTNEWWGRKKDFELFGMNVVPDAHGVGEASKVQMFNSQDTGNPNFVPWWAEASSQSKDQVSARHVSFSGSVASFLQKEKLRRHFTSNIWFSQEEIGFRHLQLKCSVEDATVADAGLVLYNADQVVNARCKRLKFTTCFGNNSFSLSQAPLKWSNCYILARAHCALFDVELCPDANGVVENRSSTVWYNASETTNPAAFNRSSCRHHIYRDLRAKRLGKPLIWHLRRHSIASGDWGEFWGSESNWKSALQRPVSFVGVPFALLSKDIVLYSENQIVSLDMTPKGIVDLIYEHLCQRSKDILVTGDLELKPICMREEKLDEVTRFWVSRVVAERVMGLRIADSATASLSSEGGELFNANDTSDPSLFSSKLRPCRVLGLNLEMHCSSSYSFFPLFCRHAIKHKLTSSFWLSEQEWYAHGVCIIPNESFDVNLFGVVYRNSEHTTDPNFAFQVISSPNYRLQILLDHCFGTGLGVRSHCPVCKKKNVQQVSLSHILSCCAPLIAWYKWRHDCVLCALYTGLINYAGGTISHVQCDLEGLSLPQAKWQLGGLRPDLCFKFNGTPIIVELSVPFSSLHCAKRANFAKTQKYNSARLLSPEGEKCQLYCIEVGSCGQIDFSVCQLDYLFRSIQHARKTRNAMSSAAVACSKEILQLCQRSADCGATRF